MCGNHAVEIPVGMYGLGSPPRVREPRLQLIITVGAVGITPACAGTTLLS